MANVQYYDVILKPVVTEKSMNAMTDKKYTFLVHTEANKTMIKEAVEKMFDGTKGCIISDTGIQRFKGDWGIEAQEVIPAAGIHRYLIAGEDELRLVYLTN